MKYLSKLAGLALAASLYGCGGDNGSSVSPVININGYSKLNKTCTGIVNVSVDAENGKNAKIRHGKNSQNKDSTELKKNGNRYEGEVEFKEPGKYFIDYEVSDGNNKKNSEESTLEIIASKKDFYNYAVTSLKDKNISFTEDKDTINGKKLRYMMKATNKKGAPLYIYYQKDENCNDSDNSDDINIINNVKLDSLVINNYYNNIPSSLEELMNQLLAALNNANRPPTVKYLTANPNPTLTNNATTLMAGVSDPDGDALTITWSSLIKGNLAPAFAIDTTTTKQVIYSNPGTDTVNIIVSDGSKTASSSMNVAINDPVIINNAPVANFSVNPSSIHTTGSALVNNKSNLASTSTDADGNNLSCTWSTDIGNVSGNTCNTDFSSVNSGTANVTLSVSDGIANNSTSKQIVVTVNNNPSVSLDAVINETYHPGRTHPGKSIVLNYNKSDSDGTVTNYVLNQINGTATLTDFPSSNTANVLFNVIGDHVFKNKAYDDDGMSNEITKGVNVFENAAPNVSLSKLVYGDGYHPGKAHPGGRAMLDYGYSDFDGAVTAYAIEQLSGPASTITNFPADTTANVDFLSMGTHVYRFRDWDDDSGMSLVTQTIDVVNNNAPVANAGNDKSSFVGILLTFDGSLSYDSDGQLTSCSWDFGDSTTYTETNTNAPDGTFDCKVNHAYSNPNLYTVTLTGKDDDNTTSIDTCQVDISP